MEGNGHEYGEEGRRVKAAMAYSGLSREDFATEVGYAPRTLDRTTAGRRAPTLPELRRIARKTDVPLLFLTHGWGLYRLIETGDTDQAVRLLRHLIRMQQNQRSLPPPTDEGRSAAPD